MMAPSLPVGQKPARRRLRLTQAAPEYVRLRARAPWRIVEENSLKRMRRALGLLARRSAMTILPFW